MRGELESGVFTGDLFVTRKTGERGQLSSGSVTGAVLRTEQGAFLFRSSIGGGFNFSQEEHIHTEGDKTVYYPHYNETQVEVNHPRVEEKDTELVQEDVSVRYILTDELYICSELETTAYAPNYLVQNETVYSIETPLLVEGGEAYSEDKFLGLDRVEGVVSVQNTQTGRQGEVSRERVDELVENESPNGAIPVQDPETPNSVHSLKNNLR